MRLRVVSSNGQGRIVLVEGDEAIIGRDPDCDVVLDNIFISRFHARVRRTADGYELTDLNSRNGVLIGDNPVQGPMVLPADVPFTIGPFQLSVAERSQLEQVTQPFTPQSSSPSALLVVDPDTHEVLVDGAPVRPRLSPLEFRLLAILDDAHGRVCERSSLGDAIWGEEQWDLNMLHRLIHRLKEKIEPLPDQPRFVITVPGVGYRLEAS